MEGSFVFRENSRFSIFENDWKKMIEINLPRFPKSKRKRIREKHLKRVKTIVENAILKDRFEKMGQAGIRGAEAGRKLGEIFRKLQIQEENEKT